MDVTYAPKSDRHTIAVYCSVCKEFCKEYVISRWRMVSNDDVLRTLSIKGASRLYKNLFLKKSLCLYHQPV